MVEDCIFCKIAKGELPADKVYEDDEFIVFQALYQVSPGHTLIVPKEHSQDILNMKGELGLGLLKLIQKIGSSAMSALGATGFNTGINTKVSAGQAVFHTHIHIIPRYDDDNMESWPEKETTAEDRALFAQKMIMKLD